MMEQTGLIHLYCGDGKGKTSAALGVLLRASGAGLRVTLARFLKDGRSAELAAISRLENVRVLPAPDALKFLWEMTPEEKDACARESLALFHSAIADPGDVLILDELCDAVQGGLIPEDEVLTFLDGRPSGLEVVITGHSPSPAMQERADYFSQILCRRHPYARGMAARRGIEY